jgi:hypothetical protein
MCKLLGLCPLKIFASTCKLRFSTIPTPTKEFLVCIIELKKLKAATAQIKKTPITRIVIEMSPERLRGRKVSDIQAGSRVRLFLAIF